MSLIERGTASCMFFENIAVQSSGVSTKIACGWSLLLDRVMMQTGQGLDVDEEEMISRT